MEALCARAAMEGMFKGKEARSLVELVQVLLSLLTLVYVVYLVIYDSG